MLWPRNHFFEKDTQHQSPIILPYHLGGRGGAKQEAARHFMTGKLMTHRGLINILRGALLVCWLSLSDVFISIICQPVHCFGSWLKYLKKLLDGSLFHLAHTYRYLNKGAPKKKSFQIHKKCILLNTLGNCHDTCKTDIFLNRPSRWHV